MNTDNEDIWTQIRKNALDEITGHGSTMKNLVYIQWFTKNHYHCFEWGSKEIYGKEKFNEETVCLYSAPIWKAKFLSF